MKKNIYKKGSNTKSILVALVMLIVTLLVAGSITTYYISSSGNLGTRTNEATTTTYPISTKDFIQAGLDMCNTTYYYDCSGFVKEVFGRVSASGLPSSTDEWSSSTAYTYNGTSYTVTTIYSGVQKSDKTAWYNAINMNQLQPGDVVLGSGHVFIYLGYGSTWADCASTLTNMGVTIPSTLNVTSRTSACGPYWYMEGNKAGASNGNSEIRTNNGENCTPYVENYDWGDNSYDKNMSTISVFRVTSTPDTPDVPEEPDEPEGSYHFNIVKKDSEDANDSNEDEKYSEALGGATFEINQYLNKGNSGTPTATKTVTTKAGASSTTIFDETDITNINAFDTYTITEKEAPNAENSGNGYEYVNDKNWTIGLKIYKGEYTDNRY